MVNNPQGKQGVIRLEGRKHLKLKGFSKEQPTVFYTKVPAVPHGSSVNGQTYSHRRHFWLFNCLDIEIEHIRVEGSNKIPEALIGRTSESTPAFWPKGAVGSASVKEFPAYIPYWEFEHAFSLMSCQNVTVSECEVDSVWGDGVYIGGSSSVPSKNITIKHSKIRYAGRQGIAAANSVDGLLIDQVNIDMVRRSSIDLEPHTKDGYVINVEVRNSRLFGNFTAVAAVGKGNVSNFYVHGNEYRGTTLRCYGDPSAHRQNWRWENNRHTFGSYGSPVAPATFRNTDNIFYIGNKDQINDNQSRIAVEFGSCGGVLVVAGNNFINASKVVAWGSTDRKKILIINNLPSIINEAE